MATLAAAMARAAPGAAEIPAGAVARAAVAAAEVVRRVLPTEDSERRRAGVIDYVRRLVGAALGCEVFAFGSVPLKTYLPDGDIDLTVLGNISYHSTLIDDVYCILQSEEQNSDAEFEVKDSQHINAEVRLIKCTIDNIIVDISFNQTGGISALCFLELVDRRVGKNHPFKRSIILIKAWCYYESRLLGAHHGLISTYALEILILYIFNLFHKCLHGPLEVLYRFLEYFSKFDWDSYCISLNGPVALSSLPNLIVEATNTHDDDLLFDKEFLRSSVDKAFVPPRDSNACYTRFHVKHLNIIDPLKEHNNLGRSVNRASFNRIRTAFSYGAQKLGQILLLPPELIPDEIYGFFKNTLKRNGKGVRPDIGNGGYDNSFYCQRFPGPGKELLEEISSMKISYKEDENRSPHHLSKNLAYKYSNIKINGPTHVGGCFPGDHKVASSTDLSTKSPSFVHHAPKQYSLFYQENGNGSREQYCMDHEMQAQVSRCTAEAFHVDDRSLMWPQVHVNNSSHTLNSSTRVSTLELSKPGPMNKKNLSVAVTHLEKHHLLPFSSLSLPDLSGDLDSQLRCLRQVQYHLEYLFDGFLQSFQEAFFDDKVDKDSFKIPTLSILLNTDVTLPRLLSPSSAETDGRKSSPVSYSTEDVSQQSQDEDHWDMASEQNASGSDVPSNGLSPSSSHADKESSVSWCHSWDDIPNMHGTGPYIPEKHMASLEEKGKTLIDHQPVKIKNNQASVPKGSSVPYKQQVALDSGTKETTNQPLKVQDNLHGCIRSDRKLIEQQSCDTQKECVKPELPDNEARQITRYYGDVCSNKFQKRNYDTHMECVQPATATKQMSKHQPLEVQDTPNEGTYINSNLARKQSYDTRKGHEILDWPTEHVPISEPFKLQSSLRGRIRSNENSAAKQNYGNHKEQLSFVRDAEHVPSSQALSILNGSKREVHSKKDLVENGSKPRPLSPKEPLSASNTCQLSFPVMKGYSQSGALETPPEETIEFGSLGPFSLAFFSSKSKKAPNTHTTSKACADSPASVLQSYRAGATQSRSPGLYKLGDEDHFPPLHAGTR